MLRANCPTTEQQGMSLKEARRIQNLVVVGPEEIADLFKISLGLIPNPPLTVSREFLEAKIAKRGNKLGLILRLKKIDQEENNLLLLNNQFGKEGKIKKGLLYSDWYVENKEATFARQPVCQIKAEWVLADLELPEWSFRKDYSEQKAEAVKCGLRVKTASSDAFDLLLIAAVTGKKYRQSTWGRTVNVCEDLPVLVGFFDSTSLKVYRRCSPKYRLDWLGLSCEEVVSS